MATEDAGTPNDDAASEDAGMADVAGTQYTATDVATHSSRDSCSTIARGEVYDVTAM